MWLLVLNGLAYLVYGLVTGRLRERLLPIRLADLVQTVRDTLRLKIAHEDLTTYNAVQKLLYIVVILAGIAQVVTGLAIWKPVQFSRLSWLLGGFHTRAHHPLPWHGVIVGFLIVHVLLSLLVPQTLWAMLAGGPRVGPSGHAEPAPLHEVSIPARNPSPDPAILDDHRPLIRSLERRRLIRGGLSLGALTMLTGCDLRAPPPCRLHFWPYATERQRAGDAVRPQQAGADLSGLDGAEAARVQRLLRR